jgi:hypothetical protein
MEPINMRSSLAEGQSRLRRIGTSPLRFAAMAILFAPAASALSQAAEDKYTTAVLYEECGHPASSVQKAHCNGFVHGFLVGALTGYEIADRGSLFCGGTPEVALLVIIFQKFVRAHPETLHLEAKIALVAALESAFPCPQAK